MSDMGSDLRPAGWYDAPGDATRYRYWDGTTWTENFSPKGGTANSGPSVQTVMVDDKAQLAAAVTRYISLAFTIQQQTDTSVTMFKKKKFDFGKYGLGILCCIIPGILYLFSYAAEKDQTVVISISTP